MFQPGFKASRPYDEFTFIGMIKNLGLHGDLNFAYDAADINSWAGSGQTWSDVSGNGNDLWRGLDATTETQNDCVYHGTAGDKSASEFWEQGAPLVSPAGHGLFTPKTNPPSYVQPWHKNNAAFSIFGIVWVDSFSAGSQNQDVFYSTTGSSPGVEFYVSVSTDKKLRFIARGDAGALQLSTSSTDVVPLGAWTFVGLTVDEAASDGALFVNNLRTDFSAAYPSPGTLNSIAAQFFINFLQFGRIGVLGAASRAWSDAEIGQLYAKLKLNRYTTLP